MPANNLTPAPHCPQNPTLIYSILRSQKRFEELSTFTLAGGVSELRRVRLERKAAAAAAATPPTLRRTSSSTLGTVPEDRVSKEGAGAEGEKPASPGGEEPPAVAAAGGAPSEKAMGKRRERSSSVSTLTTATGDLSIEGSEGGEVFVGKHGFVPSEGWVSVFLLTPSVYYPLTILVCQVSSWREG